MALNDPAPGYQALLDKDSRRVPDVLRVQEMTDLGPDAPLDVARYTSPAFADREVEKMWKRVWQMACREEEIPEVGDVHVYEIADISILVIRTAPDRIRAFYNSCLHRGRKLLLESEHVSSLRCGFHGWTWNLDGSIRSVPCKWDFKHMDEAEFQLPEVKVGTWGGFVFINLDPDACTLEEYLGVLPAHFERWKLEDCYKVAHVARIIRANWKVAQEAFMESYHVIATHPQILPIFSDADAQYDLFGDHVNRNLAAFGHPSPHLAANPPGDAEVVSGMMGLWGRPPGTPVPETDKGARETLGDMSRKSFAKAFGGDYSDVTDAEVLDAIVYNVFPNFAPWGGFAPNIVYRWRPNGRDPDSCIMEAMILKRCPEGQPRPKPVAVHWLTEEQPWADATELPALGPVIDQDMENMPFVQQGMKSSGTNLVRLGSYQESRIRHFHRTLDKYLDS